MIGVFPSGSSALTRFRRESPFTYMQDAVAKVHNNSQEITRSCDTALLSRATPTDKNSNHLSTTVLAIFGGYVHQRLKFNGTTSVN